MAFSLNLLLLKSTRQVSLGEDGLEELSQTNLENLGSALLIFLDFNACLSPSFPASCWELTVFFFSSVRSMLGVFSGTEESQASQFYEQDPNVCT